MSEEDIRRHYREIADKVCKLFKAGKDDKARDLVTKTSAVARFEYYRAMSEPMELAREDAERFALLKAKYGITDEEFALSVEQERSGTLVADDADGETHFFVEHYTRIITRGDDSWLDDIAEDAKRVAAEQ